MFYLSDLTEYKQSSAFSNKVAYVMREAKAGKLRSGSTGKRVRNHKQAIAIALSVAKKKYGK